MPAPSFRAVVECCTTANARGVWATASSRLRGRRSGRGGGVTGYGSGRGGCRGSAVGSAVRSVPRRLVGSWVVGSGKRSLQKFRDWCPVGRCRRPIEETVTVGGKDQHYRHHHRPPATDPSATAGSVPNMSAGIDFGTRPGATGGSGTRSATESETGAQNCTRRAVPPGGRWPRPVSLT